MGKKLNKSYIWFSSSFKKSFNKKKLWLGYHTKNYIFNFIQRFEYVIQQKSTYNYFLNFMFVNKLLNKHFSKLAPSQLPRMRSLFVFLWS